MVFPTWRKLRVIHFLYIGYISTFFGYVYRVVAVNLCIRSCHKNSCFLKLSKVDLVGHKVMNLPKPDMQNVDFTGICSLADLQNMARLAG